MEAAVCRQSAALSFAHSRRLSPYVMQLPEMFAQRLARQLLGYFIDDGGQLLDAETGKTAVDLSEMFAGGTL